MRLPGKPPKEQDFVVYSDAARRPWPEAALAAVLAIFTALSLAGVSFPPDGWPALVPGVVAIVVMLLVIVGATRTVTIARVDGERVLISSPGARGVKLDKLFSAAREPAGARPALALADLEGDTLTIPLGTWKDEERLLTEIEHAIAESQADGSTGEPVPVVEPAWITPVRYAFIAAVAGLALLIQSEVSFRGGDEPSAEPVTPARLAETAGRPTSPFVGSRPCNVYLVPLDTASDERVDDLSRALAVRVSLLPCAMPSAAIDPQALDAARAQLDGPSLVVDLFDQFVEEWEARPSVVIGVTEHDLFSSDEPAAEFVFGSSVESDALQGFGVISTARMGSGEDLERRLETMAMRYVGLYYFGLEPSDDETSALYHTVATRDDLDRMLPQFADPQPGDDDLRQERARYLANL